MPIRPELRKFYGREWREVVRPRILARAKNRCEQCRKPDRAVVWVYTSSACGQYWTLELRPFSAQKWMYCAFGIGGNFVLLPNAYGDARQIRIVLTVAHLNHVPGDDRDENLKALCQWCHLNYDKLHHKETRQAHKDAARPLLAGMEATL